MANYYKRSKYALSRFVKYYNRIGIGEPSTGIQLYKNNLYGWYCEVGNAHIVDAVPVGNGCWVEYIFGGETCECANLDEALQVAILGVIKLVVKDGDTSMEAKLVYRVNSRWYTEWLLNRKLANDKLGNNTR